MKKIVNFIPDPGFLKYRHICFVSKMGFGAFLRFLLSYESHYVLSNALITWFDGKVFYPANTQGDSDGISIHIYASWFLPPSCG